MAVASDDVVTRTVLIIATQEDRNYFKLFEGMFITNVQGKKERVVVDQCEWDKLEL